MSHYTTILIYIDCVFAIWIVRFSFCRTFFTYFRNPNVIVQVIYLCGIFCFRIICCNNWWLFGCTATSFSTASIFLDLLSKLFLITYNKHYILTDGNIPNLPFYFLCRNGVSILPPALLSNYSHENAYNAEKCGLVLQCLPDKSIQLKSEKCSGGNHSKIRITGLAAANAAGEKLKQRILGVLKTSILYLVDISCRKKTG